jgi:DNA-binding NtrC family response regulator
MLLVSENTPDLLWQCPQTDTRRILLADAGNGIREHLSGVLSKLGYESVKALSWIQALKLFFNGTFDLVFIDSEIICWDGFSLAYHVKARSPQTPVVMMVGKGWEPSENREGCCLDDLLFKPFGPRDVQSVVQKHLTVRSRGMSVAL